jgi:hypothetical protein
MRPSPITYIRTYIHTYKFILIKLFYQFLWRSGLYVVFIRTRSYQLLKTFISIAVSVFPRIPMERFSWQFRINFAASIFRIEVTSNVTKETACFSKTLVCIYSITQYHNWEDHNLTIQGNEHFEGYIGTTLSALSGIRYKGHPQYTSFLTLFNCAFSNSYIT